MNKIKTVNFSKYVVYNRQNYVESKYTYNWFHCEFRNLAVCSSDFEGLTSVDVAEYKRPGIEFGKVFPSS
jgi:hypothetical protein